METTRGNDWKYAYTFLPISPSPPFNRLNLIACVFFPILAIAAIFSMNLVHGLEHQGNWLFWILVAIGIAIGMAMKSAVTQSNIADGQRK